MGAVNGRSPTPPGSGALESRRFGGESAAEGRSPIAAMDRQSVGVGAYGDAVENRCSARAASSISSRSGARIVT